MRQVAVNMGHSTIIIGKEELLIINAALNEVCNGISIFEFETRIGADRQQVAYLLKEVSMLIDQMDSLRKQESE